MSSVATTVRDLDAQARAVMTGNDRGRYTVPTKGLYPYQWNWDSAFAALGFAEFDLDRAWTELETLLSAQWANGMVPHIVFYEKDDGYFPGPDVWGTGADPESSGISQPPVAAVWARSIFERDTALGKERLGPLFDRLVSWHRWFHDYRCESGACAVTHPWESGRDNAPDWDIGMKGIDVSGVEPYQRRDTSHVNPDMRPTKYDYDRYIALVQYGREHGWDEAKIREGSGFRVADPTMTFVLLRANRDLAWIGRELGRDVTEIEGWIETLEQGAKTLWNPEIDAFDARDLHSGSFAGSLSNASFLCWFAGLGNETMTAHLNRVLDQCRYGVPSYDPEGPRFDSKRYWRGPVWAIMNIMIAMGLRESGHSELAERLRADTEALIRTHGFAEYYDPIDGSAAGGGAFTWTAAVWLVWASPSAAGGN